MLPLMSPPGAVRCGSSRMLPLPPCRRTTTRCRSSAAPPPPPSTPRLLEIAGGRAATAGLLGVSIVGNTTGASVLAQYRAEQPEVWLLVVAIVAATCAQKREDTAPAWTGRFAMTAMTAITVAEALAATRAAHY